MFVLDNETVLHVYLDGSTIHSVHQSKLRITEQGKKACSQNVATWGEW